ncbi:MAG TPA: DUF6265 family protein [Gemmatimonadales bacterium]|jgi:hypothetical protein
MRAALASVMLLPLLTGAPLPPPSVVEPPLADLAFMAGCWRGPSGDGTTIEEYYTAPAENLMLGVSRYTKGGRVTSYEFSTIAREGTEIVLTPRPSGQQPAPFRLTRLDSNGAVWENPQHDFPTLIAYQRQSKDSLVARIEGPGREGKQSFEWRMGRATCGG